MTNKDNSFSHVKAVQAAPLKSAKGVTPQAVRRRLISSCTGVAIAVFHGRVMLLSTALAVLRLLVESGGLDGGGC